jgi:hypothetical protein
MTVTKGNITTDEFTLTGNTWNFGQESQTIGFRESKGGVVATTVEDQAQNHSVTFYPKGSNPQLALSDGVSVDTNQDIIVVWTSGTGYTEVYTKD